MPSEVAPPEVVATIRTARRLLVASHVAPDADTIGSQLALCLALRDLGRAVVAYNRDPVPASLRFLPFADEITARIDAGTVFDAAIVVDAADVSRVGQELLDVLPRCGTLINVDHHRTNTGFGDLRFVDCEASATGEVVYRLLKAIPATITREIALNLYVTILTDTGSFHYTNSTAEAFRVAGEMVSLGVDPWYVAERLYERNPAALLHLLSRVLDTLELSPDGTIASVVVTRAALEATGCTPDLTDGFVGFPRSIAGVEVAVMIREEAPCACKVSLRSRGRVDVAGIASTFGGGGHRNAAACTIEAPLAEVKARVYAAVAARLAAGRDQFLVVSY